MIAGRHFPLLFLLALGGGANADDGSATLVAGGLIFVQSQDVRLLSEDLRARRRGLVAALGPGTGGADSAA
ncbi:MAG: hypothetical protein WD645_03320, partial [Dehalococcoidia bacterium]